MKHLLFISIIIGLQVGIAQTSNNCIINLFEGVDDVLLLRTNLVSIKNKYPDFRVENTRYRKTSITSRHVGKIVYLDQLGLEVHLQKQKYRNNYLVYNIKIKDGCHCETNEGLGIGSTYDEIAKVYPSILTDHSSRLSKGELGNKKITWISLTEGSIHVSFYSDGWVTKNQFVTTEITLYYSDLRISNVHKVN